MARFLVLQRSLIGLRVCEPGTVVDLDPKMCTASANLRPLDVDAEEMRAKHLDRFAELAPPGSAGDNERRRLAKEGQRLTEQQVEAMHARPAKKLTPTPGGMSETKTWSEAVEQAKHLGVKP